MVTTVQSTFRQEALATLEEANNVNHAVLISYSRRVDDLDPLAFFQSGEADFLGERFFWSDPESQMIFSGLGRAAVIKSSEQGKERFDIVHQEWEQLKQHMFHFHDEKELKQAAVGPLLFGGFSFDPHEEKARHWEAFGEAHFFVPSIMLTVSKEGSFLTINEWKQVDGNVHQLIQELEQKASRFETLPVRTGGQAELVHMEELDVNEWMKAIQEATDHIRANEYEKVVLAREVLLHYKNQIELAPLLAELLKHQTTSYVFAVEQGRQAFVGATPERLVKKSGGEVFSSCLAGSIVRGKDEAEDQALGEELLHDEKNLIEHQIVVNMIEQAFKANCLHVHKPNQPSLYKTKNIQHLFTPIVGEIKSSCSLFSLIEQLHPTPALGGYPKEKAVEVIREIEPLKRGWYAAPVGWIDSQDNGEFAVAIRSGLIEEDRVRLFAGCGIVEDSLAKQEYEETQVKLRPMLSALGGHPIE
ncbi:isochorismate synthase [Bacillus safensis]|uniref:isochorismate synthase n=1 Tax=Bacillus TaxID=1386 RepID=UPI0018CCADDF|nr:MULTISPECIES: isochorismate synthase MenF [Bacillus]MBG9819152.1 isochorismate synthase [Bacillus safensis]MBG9824501.1 isochorismate synthase [Bacillus safensis]MBG9834148.1 isochorismate synthase [Bacillus safensis]MBG9860274.1 isochorismate synthase [Bacillus safensis]MBG9899088.1 isochorismate synthase [Bacillus safensis]